MNDSPAENFHSLLKKFDQGMLVTRSADGQIRSRPMQIAGCDADSDLWFVTTKETGKVTDIDNDSHVCVALRDGRTFLSLSGKARVVTDQTKLDELWSEAWRVWFPDGKEDPNLVLIHIDATEGEYWDQSGLKGLKYLFKAGKAYLAGQRPELDEESHSKVQL
ncbi:MAG: pyridoxamine 5'-phosphate oxidase family protein [Lacipirellulaceae bacterium]